MSIHFHVLLHIWEHLLCICLRSRRLWGTTFSVFWYNFAFMGFPCGSIFYACAACVATLGPHLLRILKWLHPWGNIFYASFVCAEPLGSEILCICCVRGALPLRIIRMPRAPGAAALVACCVWACGSCGSYGSHGSQWFPWFLRFLCFLWFMAVPMAIPAREVNSGSYASFGAYGSSGSYGCPYRYPSGCSYGLVDCLAILGHPARCILQHVYDSLGLP